MQLYSRITGTGSCLPPRRLTNADLVAELAAKGVETSDDWIVERTGIRARHFADAGVYSSDLGAQAALRALEAAGVAASELDLIIVATSTPDMVFPRPRAFCRTRSSLGCAALMCKPFAVASSVRS
jgi:3-oxoacyl-[acyl-carrier-protein] synthase-3